MEKTKKITVVLLSAIAMLILCLGITFGVPHSARAAETTGVTTEVSVATYDELVQANNGASNKEEDSLTITLADNIELTANLEIKRNVTLNLNKKTLTLNGGYIIIDSTVSRTDKKGNVTTVTGTVEVKDGTIIPSSSYSIQVNTAATATISNVTIAGSVSNKSIKYGVYINKNCTGTTKITDCDITTYTACVYNLSSGRVEITGTSAIVNALETTETTESKKCKLTTRGQAVYISGSGATLIDNCALISTYTYCVYLPAGNANLTKIVNSCLKSDYVGIYDKSMGELRIDNCVMDCNDSYGLYMNKTAPLQGEKTETVSIRNSKIKTAKNSAVAYFNLTGKFTVENCKIDAPYNMNGITGNGGYHGSDVLVKDTFIEAGCGIYSPEDGNLVVDGGEINVKLQKDASGKVLGGATGIEIRAGKLTVKNNTKNTVPDEIKFHYDKNGSGGTTTGAAIAIAQHTTDKAIDVDIENATLTADVALAQVDPETITGTLQPVTIKVENGQFTGTGTPAGPDPVTGEVPETDAYYQYDLFVKREDIKHFISGGEYSVQPPLDYLVDHTYSYEEPNHKYLVITADVMTVMHEANDYVRLYAASWNVKYTDEISSIIYTNTDTTDDGFKKAREAAIAKVDEIRDAREKAKKDAITEIEAEAELKPATDTAEAQPEVPVPESVYAAINNAADADEVKAIKDKAIADIKAKRDALAAEAEKAKLAAALEKAKKDAIAAIKAEAAAKEATATEKAQPEVIVSAATYAAINEATDLDQVAEFKANAFAEIEAARIRMNQPGTSEKAEYDAQLEKAKKNAIAAVKAEAAAKEATETEEALPEVIVSAATYAAINDATDLDQVAEFKANAFAEIKAERDRIKAERAALEAEKDKALAEINACLDGLVAPAADANANNDGLIAAKAAAAYSAADGFTDEKREKLNSLYGEKTAALVEQFYNDAVAAVADATSVEQARAAADAFKRNIDTVEMINGLQTAVPETSLSPAYIILLIIIAVSAVVLVLLIALLLRRKNAQDAEPVAETSVNADTAAEAESGSTEDETEEAAETAEPDEEVADDVSDDDDAADDADDDDDADDGDENTEPTVAATGARIQRKRKPYKPFMTRLKEAPDSVLDAYTMIKNEFCNYTDVKSRISKTCESFRIGHNLFAKIKIVGQNVRLYLALAPDDYDENKYHHVDKSDTKSYALVPMMVKVNGPRSINRAITLIGDCMSGAKKNEEFVWVDYAEQVKQQVKAEQAAAQSAQKK